LRDRRYADFRDTEQAFCELLQVIQPKKPFEPEVVFVPAGEFLMGSNPEKDKDAHDDEQPQHTLALPDYYIARTPVTNAQYLAFVQAASRRPPRHWEGGRPPEGKEDHPVVYVSWHGALAYCRWLAEVTGRPYGLPSEAEWEKAASWDAASGRKRIYPWGDGWDIGRCSVGGNTTTLVGRYSPDGDSPYGCADMAGNVYEWTRSLYDDYPYDPADGREDLEAVRGRVVRGGSFDYDRDRARCACRDGYRPAEVWVSQGFRVCVVAQQE
jgi:formylglycine-generating enzyme required for sulfatase activity